MISVSPASSSTTVDIGNSNFIIIITVTRGEADVNLTRNGEFLDLRKTERTFVHVIPKVKASSNGTYIAIGDNDVGYHQVTFSLLAFCKHSAMFMYRCTLMQFVIDLGEAECIVLANSVLRGTVTCTIKSFPAVDKATYSCANRNVDLAWKEIGSADVLGVHKYQANASISDRDVPIFNGTSCRLITSNQYGIFNETVREG